MAAGARAPEPPPDVKLCDHCLQVSPCPCPRYDEHDTPECPCDHWNSEREKEKHEQWKRQWESVFERKQRCLDEWENRLRNYFADLSEARQKDEPPMFVPSMAECRDLAKTVIPAVEQLPPFQVLSRNRQENMEAWRHQHAMPAAIGDAPGEYRPEQRPHWECRFKPQVLPSNGVSWKSRTLPWQLTSRPMKTVCIGPVLDRPLRREYRGQLVIGHPNGLCNHLTRQHRLALNPLTNTACWKKQSINWSI